MSWIWIDLSTSSLLQAPMTDSPVSRSGRRSCARIKYPHPLIDCQTLCVWKPPSGPDVNSRRTSGCAAADGAERDRNTGNKFGRKKKKHKSLFKPMFCNVSVPRIEIMLRCPQTGNERALFQDRSDGSDGISSFRVIKYSVESRSTGFDLKGLCQTWGYVWKQTDSLGEIPAAAHTTFVDLGAVCRTSASFVWLPL